MSQVLVAHVCNPSYPGGRDQVESGSNQHRSKSKIHQITLGSLPVPGIHSCHLPQTCWITGFAPGRGPNPALVVLPQIVLQSQGVWVMGKPHANSN
jgi:hypothetical protein